MKKGFRIVCLAVITILVLSSFVFAQKDDEICYSEFEYIQSVNNLDAKELASLGLTNEDVKQMTENYYNEIQRRASLPDKELYSMGYTDNEIEILRLADSQRLTDLQYASISAICTGSFASSGTSSSRFYFTYSWSWNICPAICLNDASAVRWAAFDSNGYEFDTDLEGISTSIDYYYNGSVYTQQSAVIDRTNLDFYVVAAKYPMFTAVTESYNPETEECDAAYALAGRMNMVVHANNNNSISYIKACGLVCHTTIAISNMSVSASSTSVIDVTVTPSFGVSKTAIKKVRINLGGSVVTLVN